MKTDKKILFAFLLNLFFSIFEFIGGLITGSISIISDSIHDLGDSFSIGTSFIFEKISMKKPDEKYTFGYYRYSVLGSVIQSVVLLCGSFFVIYHAVVRLMHPAPIHYNGMITIGVIGFCINFAAAYFTKEGESLNQKAINLHMLEDVLGWTIVLLCAFVMRFTNWSFLDPILSITLAVFIIINAFRNLKEVLDIFLEKTPVGVSPRELRKHLLAIDGVLDVHHLHIWSMDGYKSATTLHVVTDAETASVKKEVKAALSKHGIAHSTIEFETSHETCEDMHCDTNQSLHDAHRHHHHH